METPTRAAILNELSEVSDEMSANPLTVELVKLRQEADELLDLYNMLGKTAVPEQGYEPDYEYENEWGE